MISMGNWIFKILSRTMCINAMSKKTKNDTLKEDWMYQCHFDFIPFTSLQSFPHLSLSLSFIVVGIRVIGIPFFFTWNFCNISIFLNDAVLLVNVSFSTIFCVCSCLFEIYWCMLISLVVGVFIIFIFYFVCVFFFLQIISWEMNESFKWFFPV